MIIENLGVITGAIGAFTLIGVLFYATCLVSADEKEVKKN